MRKGADDMLPVHRNWPNENRIARIALAIGLLVTYAPAQSPGQTDGTIRGVVFTVDANGEHAVIPTAKISLDGPKHIEADTNSEGKFAFDSVPSGSYTITAQAPSMTTQQNVTVTAGAVSEIVLEMKIQTVMSSTTVTTRACY
jgi:hypothetical protein